MRRIVLALALVFLVPVAAYAADVTIDAAISANQARMGRGVVWTSTSVGYVFYIDATTGDLGFSKTSDSGASWGAIVQVIPGIVATADCWYDQWTPGHTGTKMHCVGLETTNDDILYNSVDFADSDAVGTPVTAHAGTSEVAGIGQFVTIAKARPACNSGNHLLVSFDLDAGAERDTVRSVDNGANWTNRATMVEATVDRGYMFPGNDADPCDMWMLYLDSSADGLSLIIHDDSADTNSELAIIADGGFIDDTTDATGQNPYSCAVRHSDGKLVCAVWTERDSATGDFRVFTVNSSTVTELTAIASNIDDSYHPSVMVDECDRIWVGYNGNLLGTDTLGTTSVLFYALSIDDGTTWIKNAMYSEGAAALNLQTYAPLNGPRFSMVWRVGTANDLMTNAVNSVPIPECAAESTGGKGVIGG